MNVAIVQTTGFLASSHLFCSKHGNDGCCVQSTLLTSLRNSFGIVLLALTLYGLHEKQTVP